MTYKIEYEKQALKFLQNLKKDQSIAIVKRISSLADNPWAPGTEKLVSSQTEKYRVRQGVYRIIYKIDRDKIVVLIVKIGHRKDVYD